MKLLAAALLLAFSTASGVPAPETTALAKPVEWTPADGPRTLSAGGVTAALSTRPCRKGDTYDDCVLPVARISAHGLAPVTLVGQQTGAHFAVSVAIGALTRGQRVPSVLFQTYGGGAHCCEAIRVAEPVGTAFRAVDLGTWDGDAAPWPTDVSGDGRADFVFNDNAFFYAFACYACSAAPPKILNVRAGRAVDVSREAQFRPLYAAHMVETRPDCEKGDVRNGVCPSYVAAAARLGRFAEAWPVLLAHYDRERGGKDYPGEVRAFLKKHGYLR